MPSPNLGDITEIEFLESGAPPPKREIEESTPLKITKAFCIPPVGYQTDCSLCVPGAGPNGNQLTFQIHTSAITLFTDKKFPEPGTIIKNKEIVQQILKAVSQPYEYKERHDPDGSSDEEEVGVGMDVRRLKSSNLNKARGVLPAILAGGISAVAGELLELTVLRDIDNKLPLPFWMVTASVGVMLALCYQHCCKSNNASSLLSQHGKFRMKKAVAEETSRSSNEVEGGESRPLLRAQSVHI